MDGRYIAFDLETAKVLPALEFNLLRHRPLGIACAAGIIRVPGRSHLPITRSNDIAANAGKNRNKPPNLV